MRPRWVRWLGVLAFVLFGITMFITRHSPVEPPEGPDDAR